jgi:cell wall-associated NlpC family hydrolase
VLGHAAQYTGIMYSYGGSSPAGFDCSGYTSYVFGKAGISLPRSASAQQAATTPVSNPQPGDLVFFGSPAYHVGIYAGNGQMYDSGKPGIPSQLRDVFSGVSGYGRVG